MHSRQMACVSILVVLALILSTAPLVAYADDCDPAFKTLEVYDCTMGRVEHTVGLKKDSRPQCIEYRKLNISGCTVETLSTGPETHYLAIIGPEKTRDSFNTFKFQSDNDAGNTAGGLDKSRFEGYFAPGYTLDKFPSESNAERNERFIKDLKTQGKALYAGLILSQPSSKHAKKFDKQVSQYFNVKTNMVALKFNSNVDYRDKEVVALATTAEAGKRDEGAAAPPLQEKREVSATPPSQEKRVNPADAVQKGLKGLFGK